MRSQGAQVFAIPAAFLSKTGEYHWEPLMKARAIENQCFVIASAQTGEHFAGRVSHGHALVIDPWGKILLDMKNEVGIGYAELNLNLVDEIRAQIPCFGHKRKDLY
eukprot:TRINITY_DN1273_c0_g1_i2.p3 TRINITY_DN1273_c0_g1~~TRINITY_DN1273_c0_g1_i2.p3  ORF type:complete len:106 (+),score=34.05 TRINITY_DN1273_c0_g1_i2:269-586(+)